jgi:hypothetical protein
MTFDELLPLTDQAEVDVYRAALYEYRQRHGPIRVTPSVLALARGGRIAIDYRPDPKHASIVVDADVTPRP